MECLELKEIPGGILRKNVWCSIRVPGNRTGLLVKDNFCLGLLQELCHDSFDKKSDRNGGDNALLRR
jgi:hypothetical protein